MKPYLIIFIIIFSSSGLMGQQNYLEIDDNTNQFYSGGEIYEVYNYNQGAANQVPKNVILMIGDGMGVAHVFAGLTANKGHLFLENFKTIGFSRTQAGNKYITDSGAGATALAAGVKTFYGAIGVDMDTVPIKTILEEAEENGLSTGMVTVSAITHATPASFIAHQPNRNMREEIASDILKTDIEVFIGGGYDDFTKREDGRDLTNELVEKDYKFCSNFRRFKKNKIREACSSDCKGT